MSETSKRSEYILVVGEGPALGIGRTLLGAVRNANGYASGERRIRVADVRRMPRGGRGSMSGRLYWTTVRLTAAEARLDGDHLASIAAVQAQE